MARRLVLCLDAGRLLKPPCPVLFPEWGDELLVLAPGMTPEDRARCASSISAADGDGTPVEVWHLVRASLWDGHVQAIDALLSGLPSSLRQRLLHATRTVAWVDGFVADLAGADVVVRTEFEGDLPPASLPLSQRYLLPIGIRVLLDSAELLRAISFPSRPLRRVTVFAVGSALLAAELDWATGLRVSRDALNTQREAERTRACDQPCLDPELFAGLVAAFDVEPATPLTLRFFQRLGLDDRAVAAWFAAEAERIERAAENHRSELAHQMQEAIRQLASSSPAQMAGAAETRTCEAVRDSIRTELAHVSRPDRHSAQEVNEAQVLRPWGANHRVAVLRAARRRATARVFWAATSLAAVAVVLANAIGRGAPTAASWAWPDLVVPTVLSIAAIAALAIAVAGWFWARARSAVRVAADAMSQLTQHLRGRAKEAVEDARNDVRRMAMMRNLLLLDRACEERSAHVARIEAHVDAVLKLLDVCGDVPKNPVGYVAPVDVAQRPESAHAYEWATDSPRVTIRVGTDECDATDSSLQGLLRRYAGVSTIEIECQP